MKIRRSVLLTSAVMLVLGLWCLWQKPTSVLHQDLVEFYTSEKSTSVGHHRPGFYTLHARKRTWFGSGSGILEWNSETASGGLVTVDSNTGKIYGRFFNRGRRFYEFHEIGQLRSKGNKLHVDFPEGTRLTYPSNGYYRFIRVSIPRKTVPAFTKPRETLQH